MFNPLLPLQLPTPLAILPRIESACVALRSLGVVLPLTSLFSESVQRLVYPAFRRVSPLAQRP